MTDISGLWTGSYVYPGSLEPVPFRAELRDHDGQISGVTFEPAGEWAPPGDAGATLSGHRSGSEIDFLKTYDQIEDYPDPVHYAGTLDDDECEIAGTWIIVGEWSGSFVMTRPKPAKAEERAEEVVADELDRQAP